MKSTEYPYFSDKEEQNKSLYEEEGTFERERNLMKSYYPKKAADIQSAVEDACDHLDYEGSFLYDEYPDQWTVKRTCQDICRQIQSRKNMQAMDFEKEIFLKDGLAEITQALFCQEMCRRRCRRKRLKRI